jgi:hypothetical protein
MADALRVRRAKDDRLWYSPPNVDLSGYIPPARSGVRAKLRS